MMNFDDIVSRTVTVLDIEKEKELSQLLEISQQNFSNRKKKGSLLKEIVEIVLKINPEVNLDWLITGTGEKLREDKNNKPSYSTASDAGIDHISSENIETYGGKRYEKEEEQGSMPQRIADLERMNWLLSRRCQELEEEVLSLKKAFDGLHLKSGT